MARPSTIHLADTTVPAAFFPSYTVVNPHQQKVPFVFSSPHSGRIYPDAFIAQSRLDPLTLRRSEDCLVDSLFEDVGLLGAPMIRALFPRAYLDLNREPYELDPELISEQLPAHANSQSMRVLGGLGTVARIVADGEPIYREPLSLEHVLARVEQLYFPFHRALRQLLDNTIGEFGHVMLIDCHSMPSAAMTPGIVSRPDVVIGDRFGTSSDPQLSAVIAEAFDRRGYQVQMNRPYAGGYITEHYGRPARACHAVQVELNRGLYLNEATLTPSANFHALKADLIDIAVELFANSAAVLEPPAAAAE